MNTIQPSYPRTVQQVIELGDAGFPFHLISLDPPSPNYTLHPYHYEAPSQFTSEPPLRIRIVGLGDLTRLDANVEQMTPRTTLDAVDRQDNRRVFAQVRARRHEQLEADMLALDRQSEGPYLAHKNGVTLARRTAQLAISFGVGVAAHGLYQGTWTGVTIGTAAAALFASLLKRQSHEAATYERLNNELHKDRHTITQTRIAELTIPLDAAGPFVGL